MEKILKKAVVSEKTKKTMLAIVVMVLIASVLSLIINIRVYNDEPNLYFYNYRLGDVGYLPGLLDEPGFELRHYGSFWSFPFIYFAFVLFISSIVLLLYYAIIRKTEIIVTDKRVYGKTFFGRSVDLPMDSISAVGSSWFKGIAIATASGKVAFSLIEDSEDVHELLRQLLIDRQAKQEKSFDVTCSVSNADELKKYKELLDCDIITQEEFEAKKKQLLNL